MYKNLTLRDFTKVFPLFIFIALVAAWSVSAHAGPEERFLDEVRAAVGSGDDEALWSLFNLDGVEEDMKRPLEKFIIKRLRSAKLLDVELTPMPEDFRTERVVNGVRHYLNMKPLGLVIISYKKDINSRSTTRIPYGERGGRLYFVGATRKKPAGDLPPSK
jgi:hypothetical protein